MEEKDSPTGAETETPSNPEANAHPRTESGDEDEGPLKMRIIEALSTVYDPEIPVNIYELGLVYDIETKNGGDVEITMTLTTPNCPVAGSMPGEVERVVSSVEGAENVKVNLVWDPPWTQEMMSEAARLELGFL